jgi:1,4-alpha-glucan branching enzyme
MQDVDDTKMYYQWQIDSLKRAVSPRYIRLLDIYKYAESGKILNKGILFSYTGLKNYEVELCGNFSNWKCLPMRKNQYGVFYAMIPPTSIDEEFKRLTVYQYKFKVDGLFEYDPENQEIQPDDSGSFFSIYHLDKTDKDKFSSTIVLEDSENEEHYLRTVKFQIYLPEKDSVSVAGDFNNWNIESDYMRKLPNGIFELEKKLLPGTYYYQFVADGESLVDKFNPNVKVREPYDELVSELVVEERKTVMERK